MVEVLQNKLPADIPLYLSVQPAVQSSLSQPTLLLIRAEVTHVESWSVRKRKNGGGAVGGYVGVL